MSIILGLLNILLYAILLVIVLEVVFFIIAWALTLFEITPAPAILMKIKKLCYAFCAVLVLIMFVSLLAGVGPVLPPLLHGR